MKDDMKTHVETAILLPNAPTKVSERVAYVERASMKKWCSR
jgi:hypothetical protein